MERRLSAILAADVVGYSRLMGLDEAGTLLALKVHRRELVDGKIAEHQGRIVKLTGDGMLVEFPSVVNAVACAADIQRKMGERNAGVPENRRIEFRIGVNLGDIIFEDGDIFGDGVNVAARIESIAKPGGVSISGSVRDQVGDRLPLDFEDMGEQALKNIDRQVRVFDVTWDREAGSAVPSARLAKLLTLPDKPLIAVLPFQNMSGDAEQDYFADGIVEDIITALSRFRSFAVIARNSSFVYKGGAVDVRHVAKELGVRYVLEGSVRRAGQRLRITAQLVEAKSGSHLWAEKFDGAIEDVFDVQDRITESVAIIVEPQIQRAEIERSQQERPGSLAAYDLYLQSLPKHRHGSPEQNAEAFALLSKAIALEPNNALMLAQALTVLSHRCTMGWQPLTADDKAICRDLIRRALANSNDNAYVLALCGDALVEVTREYDLGLATLQRAVETNPNSFEVMMYAGVGNIHCGSLDDALRYFDRALRLSTAGPVSFVILIGIAHVQMIRGQYAEALAVAERSLGFNPSYNPAYWMLIAANAQLGRMDEARGWLAKFRTLVSDITVAKIKAGQADKDPTRMASILEGLRLAGLEEG
jgi:adenylate cyclase